ncbi:MAG: HAD-IIIC family phosphatase, partial [Myxococcales bacterium]
MRPEERFLAALARRRILLASEANRLLFRAPAGSLDDEVRGAIRDYKQSLVSALKPRPGFVQLAPPSYNQLSLYFLRLADPVTAAYNLAIVMRLRSALDVPCMRKALERLARRHEQLRTTIEHIQLGDTAVLCQWIAEDLSPVLEEFDMGGATDSELRQEAQKFYAAPLNLEAGPTIHAGVFSRSGNDQVLVIKLHHVVADGWSLGIIARDLGHYYRGATQGKMVDPENPPQGTYTDFALDQLEFLSQPDGTRQMQFWLEAHTPVHPGLELPIKVRRPSVRRSVGATHYFEIDAEELSRLTACAQSLNVTLFALLLAAFQTFLLNRSKQGDVCIGIPTLGRRGEQYDETVGYFVNPVALRSRRPEALSFRAHAQRTAAEMNSALDHRDAPFAAVVESLPIKRDPSRTPVFQVLFNLLSRRMLGDVVDLIYPSPSELAIDFGGLTASSFDLDQQEGQFDLTLEFVDRGNGLFGLFKYCTDLFGAEDARQMVGELRSILASAVADPDAMLLERASAAPAVEAPKSPLTIAATFTAEAMQDTFEYWFERLGWQNSVAFAPFNQVFQTLLDPNSILRKNSNQPGVVLLRLDDLLGREVHAEDQQVEGYFDRLRANLDALVDAVAQAARAASAPLIVAVCPSSPTLLAMSDERPLRDALVGQLQGIQGVYVLAPEIVAAWYPVDEFYEPLGEKLGNIPYTPQFLTALASGIIRTLYAVTSRPCKAIAIDCDNTLWDGVVGEEGVKGLAIGPDQREFQAFLLEQFNAGVVLCLCSKNQESDVWSVFEQHPDMLLRREHIGFWRINWESKAANLRELADEINIGADAFVFLDDNPVERGEMAASCPGVLCAEFPLDWSKRVPYLRQLWAFDHMRVTDADRQRNEHYRSERLRKDLQSGAGSLGDFLAKLELQVDIHAALPHELERLAQLSIRTNQFNTTVYRMTLQDV